MTLKTVVALLAVTALAAYSLARAGGAETAAAKRIVCFGDSITEGYKVTDAFTTPYPAMLQRLLDEKRGKGTHAVVNAGVSGQDTRQATKRIDAVIEKEKPDAFIILYGANDLWTSRRISEDETDRNLREIVGKAKASGATCFIATLIPVWDTDAKVAGRNEIVKRVAKDTGIGLVDTNAAFERAFSDSGGRDKRQTWEKFYQSEDGGFLHPNDRGNGLLAQAFFDAMTRS